MTEFQRQDTYWDRAVGKYCVDTIVHLLPGDRLLDIGCGDGSITAELCKFYSEVVAIDRHAPSLHEAQLRCSPDAHFYAVGIDNLKLEHLRLYEDVNPERFDAITMTAVLEHLPNPVKSLRHAATFLNDSGKMFVAVPNAAAINRRIGLNMGVIDDVLTLSEYDIEMGNRRYYTRRSLWADCEAAGLEVVKAGGIMFKTLSSPQMEWFLANGKWDSGEFGWGNKDAFIQALYYIGRDFPEECNLIYVVLEVG